MEVSGIDDVTLSSDGGDVAVSGPGGLTTVDTGGGNLTASDLAGIVKFSTSGGDITGNDLAAPSVNAGSGGGNVTLVFTQPPANLDITSDGGDVTVLLPHGTTAYRITSTSDGGDESRVGADQPAVPAHDQRRQRRRRHQHRRSELTGPGYCSGRVCVGSVAGLCQCGDFAHQEWATTWCNGQ